MVIRLIIQVDVAQMGICHLDMFLQWLAYNAKKNIMKNLESLEFTKY